MVPQRLLPTRLIHPQERPPVVIEPAPKHSRFRALFLLCHLGFLGADLLWLKLTFRLTPTRFARLVSRFLLRAGTVGVKLGQTLGMRSDLLPPAFSAELATLREPGIAVPFAAIRRVVEKELGEPLESRFEEFSPEPFAATMSFQVHRARLRREQVWVAVKVLSPCAEETYSRDVALLRQVTGWLHYFGLFPKMRWLDLCQEVEEQSGRELDLRFEAAALRQLGRTLPPHGVYVPQVFSAHSTRRLLVMEFIHAALMSDYVALRRNDPDRLAAWLQENNIHPRKLARRLFHSVWRQVLEDNLFHTDLHPYNVILLRDSRLAVIDCRGVGELEAESLVKHRGFVEALADGEYATAAEYSFLLASRLPLVDLGEVKAEMVRVWRLWENRNYVLELPARDKSLTRMLDDINRILYRHQFEAQWSLARLAWTLVNADTSILHLASDVNYFLWLRQYLRLARRRGNRINLREVADRSAATAASVLQLPKAMAADSVAQQEVLRRQARVFRGSTSKSGYFLASLCSLLATALLLAGGLLVCAFLHQRYDTALEPVLGEQLTWLVRKVPHWGDTMWLVVGALVTYFHRRLVQFKRVYLQQDVVRRPEARPAI
jgi:ubiquinone biosynthesis protein